MRRVRSHLKDGGFPIVVIAGVNLFMVLCICVLLTNHLVPRFGFKVQPQSTHFVMGSYDRDRTHVVSVAPGDMPRLYVGANLVTGGYDGFEKCLTEWGQNESNPARISVILVLDKAVSAGMVQKLSDMVLSHGFTCSYAGVPALE